LENGAFLLGQFQPGQAGDIADIDVFSGHPRRIGEESPGGGKGGMEEAGTSGADGRVEARGAAGVRRSDLAIHLGNSVGVAAAKAGRVSAPGWLESRSVWHVSRCAPQGAAGKFRLRKSWKGL
jgi:hypothetical protein